LAKPIIVMNAGIASENNIKWLRKHGYRYIVVSRKRKKEIPSDVKLIPVKIDHKAKNVLVRAGLAPNKETNELELYCSSVDKQKKEESIKTKFQERFEAELVKARNALELPNGTKNYEKVIERVSRLKEEYKLVSHRYDITIQKDPESHKAKNIVWSRKKVRKTSGVYCLRTNCNDLNEQEIWNIYTMLTDIEDAFRCMKSELGLRPIYHHIERRCDGHIFITLLAYHILHTIRFKLRQKALTFPGTPFALNFRHKAE
ncbi:MAG: transposase, partial [Deltaproteobacteria bacterium]|nr:transposase [Deltaproteobacteria bacterium]